jgi:hypothetical protein
MLAKSVAAVMLAAAAFSVGNAGGRARGEIRTLGPAPVDCAAIHRDFSDPSCLTQGAGGLSLSPHEVHAGGTLTGSTGECKIGFGNENPCPIDWSGLTGGGGAGVGGFKHTRCGAEDRSCTITIPRNAGTSRYTIVTLAVTNGFGRSISKDYFAIVGKGRREISGAVTDQDGKPLRGEKVTISGAARETLKTDRTGAYAVSVQPGRYVVRSAKAASEVTCSGTRVRGGCRLDVRTRDGTAAFVLGVDKFKRLFADQVACEDLSCQDELPLGDVWTSGFVYFSLKEWDPNGGPVTVTSPGQPAADVTLNEAGESQFRQVKVDLKPAAFDRAHGECRLSVDAKQGVASRRLKVVGKPITRVLYARAAQFRDVKLKTGDVICEGDFPHEVPPGTDFPHPVTVPPDRGEPFVEFGGSGQFIGQVLRRYVYGMSEVGPDGRPTAQLWDAPPGVQMAVSAIGSGPRRLHGGVPLAPGQTFCIRLGAHEAVLLRVAGNRIVKADGRECPRAHRGGRSPLVPIPTEGDFPPDSQRPPAEAGDLLLQGHAVSGGDMSAHSLTLDGGILLVRGDLTVRGALRGTGAVFATGSVAVGGAVDLTSDDVFTVVAHGDVILGGRRR